MNIERTPLVLLDSAVAAIESVRQQIEAAAVTQGWHVQIGFSPERTPFSQIVDSQPALMVIATDPLPDWLIGVAANSATRRLTFLAVEVRESDSAFQILRSVGVTNILSPDEITAEQLIALVSDRVDRQQLIDECGQTLPPLVIKGIHEFNAHEFFECHETLETAWRAESGPVRNLYRVILQVGLAYYQIERSQYPAALKMFLRAQRWFSLLPESCQGVDVAQLYADAAVARTHLETLGADRIADFDRSLIKPVLYKEIS